MESTYYQHSHGYKIIAEKYIGNVNEKKFNSQDKMCVICFEEMKLNSDFGISSLSCSHHFHSECIKKWLEKKTNCPCCREKSFQWNILKKEFEKTTVPVQTNNFAQQTGAQQSQQVGAQQSQEIGAQINNLSYTRHTLASGTSILIVFDRQINQQIIALRESHILLVQEQCSVSYEQATNALIKHNGIVTNAIIELTA